MPRTILVTGATGFVGQHLCRALAAAGACVVGASRHPGAARAAQPAYRWVELDADRPETIPPALDGIDAAFYLIHSLDAGDDYARRDAAAAEAFLAAAERTGLERIVYLGGVSPAGVPSKHLWSRLRTGEALRAGAVSTVELRCSMIVGHGSTSWKIVRDIAARLPIVPAPTWLRHRSMPIGIDDVVAGLMIALDLDVPGSRFFDLPGPEALSGADILKRIARALGVRPLLVPVPLVTPRFSSRWLRFVTATDPHLLEELVAGMSTSLVGQEPGLWALAPDHPRVPFDEAVRRALAADTEPAPLAASLLEWAARLLRPSRERP